MTTLADEDAIVAPAASSRLRRIVGFVVGLLLFAAAIVAVLTRRTALGESFDAIRHAPIWLGALALLLPLVNWHLISVSFWVLTRRYGMVGLGEMHALIGSAWLLNYLPLRPGMFGRLAYHKRINHIHLRDSVKVLASSVMLTVLSNVLICAVAALSFELSQPLAWTLTLLPGVVISAAGLFVAGVRASLFAPIPGMLIAFGVRYFDILTWVARYAVIFALIGHPVSLTQATLITAVSQAALLVPFVGNGLGVREWGIGLALPVLHSHAPKALGLTADLLNRGAEVLVAVPVGLACSTFLWRRRRRYRARAQPPAGRHGPRSKAIPLQSEPDPTDASPRTGS